MAENDAWRAYVELVLGLTETSRKKAMKIVQQVAGKGGATAEQLQDLIGQGMANREALTRMIKVEMDRALGRVGLATMEEVDELTRRVRDLERELQETRAGAGNHGTPAAAAEEPGPAATATAGKTAATATPAKKTVAKKTAAKKAAPSTTATKATGTTASKTTAAKKTATSAKTTPARKSAAKKTATGTGR